MRSAWQQLRSNLLLPGVDRHFRMADYLDSSEPAFDAPPALGSPFDFLSSSSAAVADLDSTNPSDSPTGRMARASRLYGMKVDAEGYAASGPNPPQQLPAALQSPRSCATDGQERGSSSPPWAQPSATAPPSLPDPRSRTSEGPKQPPASAATAASDGRGDGTASAAPDSSAPAVESNLHLRIVHGGLLDPEVLECADFICHQVNCVSMTVAGLAEALASTLPYADPCEGRVASSDRSMATVETRLKPGTMRIRQDESTPVADNEVGNAVDSRPVVVEFASQYYPGKASDRKLPSPKGWYSRREKDSPPARLAWFQQCLGLLSEALESAETAGCTVAFPWGIGCGLGGGKWDEYHRCLREFADKLPHVTVLLVQRSCDAVRGFSAQFETSVANVKAASASALSISERAPDPLFRALGQSLVAAVEDSLLSPDGALTTATLSK